MSFFSARSRRRRKRNEGRSSERVDRREREKDSRKVEEERKEGCASGVDKRSRLKSKGRWFNPESNSQGDYPVSQNILQAFGIIGDRFDLKLIPEFNGSTPVPHWVEKVELHCLLSGVKSIEHVIPGWS